MRNINEMVLQLANKIMELEKALAQSSNAKLRDEIERNLYAIAWESGVDSKHLQGKSMAEQNQAYLAIGEKVYQDLKENVLVGSLASLKVQ